MVSIRIDLAQAVADARLGPDRAAAFVGTIMKLLDHGVPESISRPSPVSLQILPDPLPESLRQSIADELPAWAIANALKDLDQFYSIFLDNLWHAVQASRIELGEIPRAYPWESIDAITRTETKHRKVLKAARAHVGALVEDTEYLASLSDGRNCLAHNLGIIDEKRAPDGTFVLKWLRLKILASQPGKPAIELDHSSFPWTAEEGAEISVEVVVTKKAFSVGDRFTVSWAELNEICFLYKGMIDRAALAVEAFAREAGLLVENEGAQTSA